MTLHFHVQARMPHAPAFLAWLQSHLEAEGVLLHPSPQGLTLHMPQVGTLAFHSRHAEGFHCDIDAVDDRMAELIQLSLDEHAQEFLTDNGASASALQLEWHGLPTADLRYRFQVVQIIAVTDITPHMRRVRLAVPVMTALADDGLHVRLLLPPPNATVQWPQLNAQGRLQWAAGQTPLPQRIYTIRQYDTRAQWVDIDIVRHDHDAPGAQWLAQAKPGDHVGLLGPSGGHLPQAPHLLLVADMTALPAALRIAQQQGTRGSCWQLLALATHAGDTAYIPAAAHVQWHVGDIASQPAAVQHWLRAQAASATADTQLWLAGGKALVQATKTALKTHPLATGIEHKLAVYWQ